MEEEERIGGERSRKKVSRCAITLFCGILIKQWLGQMALKPSACVLPTVGLGIITIGFLVLFLMNHLCYQNIATGFWRESITTGFRGRTRSLGFRRIRQPPPLT